MPASEVDFERDSQGVRISCGRSDGYAGLRGRYSSSGLAAARLTDRARTNRQERLSRLLGRPRWPDGDEPAAGEVQRAA